MKSMYNKIVLSFFISLLIGCTKNEIIESESNALAEVVVRFNDYKSGDITKSNSISVESLHSKGVALQRLKFNEDFDLVAELIEHSNNDDLSKIKKPSFEKDLILKSSQNEAVSIPMSPSKGYLVVAFDKSTKHYVDQAFYVSGSESETSFLLPASREYEFVCVSYNYTGNLNLGNNRFDLVPNLQFRDNNRILDNAYVSGLRIHLNGVATNDVINESIYYYQRINNIGVLSVGINNLNFNLEQKQALLKLELDVTETGYSLGNFRLINGIVLGSDKVVTGEAFDINLNTGFIVQQEVNDLSYVHYQYSSVDNNYIFSLSQDTVLTNLSCKFSAFSSSEYYDIFFKNVLLKRGARYTLQIKIMPTDEYLIHKGYPAVRINNKIWMKYELGANTSAVADENNLVKGFYGNFYLWGRKSAIANVDGGLINTTYTTKNEAADAWNLGTEESPIKNIANDPCPEGWRVPTATETDPVVFNKDVNYSSTPNYGTSGSANTNFSFGINRTSIRKSSVFLTFPASGYFSYNTQNNSGSVSSRGFSNFLINSSVFNPEINRYYILHNNSIQTGDKSYIQINQAFPIRCIAETEPISNP